MGAIPPQPATPDVVDQVTAAMAFSVIFGLGAFTYSTILGSGNPRSMVGIADLICTLAAGVSCGIALWLMVRADRAERRRAD